ncbi:AAA family ATPase [Mycolicibacterium sp. BiH015]|uniref:AAA family ATPase n=1 Tax=Mycolicibacterium sp. BiH015 TaxID=3018808 RepID=UPI0022DFF757|nr:adenylate/guanylate cyclase domain-containing protein [Mycolicibacterium sp. BiH015]MDA2890256.1 AAA family ATPase [Mycolicibacterium sp. BiH015]
MTACGSCGTVLAETAKFCNECGTPTAVRDSTAKYKQVTVLFADVVRSMDLAAAVDIERLRAIMVDLFQRCTAVVQRYGGLVEYNGDGVMALFGAPIALEDHAFRGCLAALALQEEAGRLAAEVQRDDGVTLQLRVGLNSGRVITGEIGSAAMGYRATGLTVGMAQRLESVAPPGGVMLSESTARLVEHRAVLAEPEWLRVKGAAEPVCARRLVTVRSHGDVAGRADGSLVGRRWEMAALEAMMERAVGGRGAVVNVIGPPGIGKSRIAREVATLAAARGLSVVWAFCESHAQDLSFGVITALLRAALGVTDTDDREAARTNVQRQFPDADPQDLLLLNDFLGIADPAAPLPQIDADARRRRVTALVNTLSLSRKEPALFIVEDAHWIDAVSASMLSDFLAVLPRTPSMVLVTSRPDHGGPPTWVSGTQTVALAPLGDSDTEHLLDDLMGTDSSVGDLASVISHHAAGNPFFAEEMVRELVQRGVLQGTRGDYTCQVDAAEVSVPVSVYAAIEARIDRLSAAARQTLSGASVIGARFSAESLAALGFEVTLDELLDTDLIDQVRFAPSAEYAFHHPLIRAVAYESQLKSDRARWHRRVADAIQKRDPDAADENAALIAEHLEDAGEALAAYSWHMRAAGWSASRDPAAARLSWKRAYRIAAELPADDPAHLPMQIAPATMLCATDWRDAHVTSHFEELRALCQAAGDKVSLAIGMSGLATELLYAGRTREGSALASEQMALLESIGDSDLTIGLAMLAFLNWFDTGECHKILPLAQLVIELADGDPAKGAGLSLGSPLAACLAWRGFGRWWLGHLDWRADLEEAVAMARASDQETLAAVVSWTYSGPIQYGVRRADDAAVRLIEDAVKNSHGSSNAAVAIVVYTLGTALFIRGGPGDRDRALDAMHQVRDLCVSERAPFLVPVIDMWFAKHRAECGDLDGAITAMRSAVDSLLRADRMGFGLWSACVLVETLLVRGRRTDIQDAEGLIAGLSARQVDDGRGIFEVWLLRLRALLARTRGNDSEHREMSLKYRAAAEKYGYEGHIGQAPTV